jgi:hypothetical protein
MSVCDVCRVSYRSEKLGIVVGGGGGFDVFVGVEVEREFGLDERVEGARQDGVDARLLQRHQLTD